MQAFLLAATQNNVTISHIKGSNNLLSDFGSRNSVSCSNSECSICKFVNDSELVSVNAISVSDIINGHIKVPFSSNSAWLKIQLNCPSIQLTRKHLQQGTRPMKKQRNIKLVRQLLRIASVNNEGHYYSDSKQRISSSTQCKPDCHSTILRSRSINSPTHPIKSPLVVPTAQGIQ